MKPLIVAALLLLSVSTARPAEPAIDTGAVQAAIGRPGQIMDGGVYRVAFPRSDLSVTIGGIKLLPGFALGSYAAFIPTAQGALVIGDLVLLDTEVKPVMDSLERSGFEITALHNHLRYERPHVMYMHFMIAGDAGAIARNLRTALSFSKTPLAPLPGKPTPQPLAFQSAIEQGLGRSGRVSGGVLSVSAPRVETTMMDGVIIPPSAGVATAMNFQDAGSGNVATTGDFVLIAAEVGPVQRALLAHGIEVTALHSHMLDDTPHLYYMHFWAVGPPASIAAGLKDALSHVNLKP